MVDIERTFDDIDLKILEILQEKARIPNAEVARQVGMAPSAVLERIRKLEQQGVIEGYEVRLNPAHFGQGLVAFIQLQTQTGQDVCDELMRLANIQEIFQVSGAFDYLVKLRVTSVKELGRFVKNELTNIPGVLHINTHVVLDTLKETRKISLDQG